MTKQKEIGYKVGSVAFNNLNGYKELWNKASFETKEQIVNEQGKMAIKMVTTLAGNQRELLTDFAVFMVKNLESGKTPAHLVEEYYKQLGEQASM